MNIILATDSYKLGHWAQYPAGTTGVYSYFESRPGARFDHTVFVGLQSILKGLEGQVVTRSDVWAAYELARHHFGDPNVFNKAGWMHIVMKHGGRLPVRIKAVPEGTPVPVGNVLMTVENTCPECFWLTNALESLLTHVWYPSTVATLSRTTLQTIGEYLNRTAENADGLPFMLHDFGYRGATTHDAAAIGGLGHLVNGLGTDTLPAMMLAIEHYDARPEALAFSVPATEHSVMTALGAEGEWDQVERALAAHPTGIVSIVADSYNIYEFVDRLGKTYREQILARDGKVVIRPDSVTPEDPTPAALMIELLGTAWYLFGGTVNAKGYKVLDPHIGFLWGDGIDPEGIEAILWAMENWGYSAENIVFGMGGGLLQKVNRDTQRFAFKCSAQQRDGVWHDVQKKPLDTSKASKAGRLCLVQDEADTFSTVRENDVYGRFDLLETVFENGSIVKAWSFDEVRMRASM